MFNIIGQGYSKRIAGWLTDLFNNDNVRTAELETDVTDSIILAQLASEFQNKIGRAHV